MSEHSRFLLLISFGAILTILVIWFVPKLQARSAKSILSNTELPMAENEFRKTLAQVISGLFVLGGFFFTWQQISISQNNFRDQLKTSQENFQKTVELQEKGRITERLTRATEQLNDDEHIAARLGGVYALRRVLRESRDSQDRENVAQILAAFVRENAGPAVNSISRNKQAKPLPRDVVAAIAAISARPLDEAEVERRLKDSTSTAELDLRGLDLRRLYPRGTLRRRPNLSFLDLECADLRGSALIYADLIDVDLGQADLDSSDLSGTDLRKAILDEANMANADLGSAKLGQVSMNQTILVNVDLRSTDINQQQVDAACMDEQTIQLLPQGIRAPNPCRKTYNPCRTL